MTSYRDIETKNMYERKSSLKDGSHERIMEAIYAKGRDNSRTPMQWDASNHKPASRTAHPWLAVNPNHQDDQRQESDRPSIRTAYTPYLPSDSSQLRKQCPVFARRRRFELLYERRSRLRSPTSEKSRKRQRSSCLDPIADRTRASRSFRLCKDARLPAFRTMPATFRLIKNTRRYRPITRESTA
ncbi:MAG: hypothetical protein MZU97_00570 [Bacillus subtilis]|nr:hypothetical protein [Bacillus subtilis]